jgi:serine protein kinase
MDLTWIEEANKETHERNETLSFEEYMDYFENHAAHETRPNCLYLKDMFDYFGKTENNTFKLFLTEFTDSPPVFGQIEVQNSLYQNLLNFSEEGSNNRLLLLVGPNGSAKSTIINKVMKGAEEYSKTDEGALYTFSWIFPIDTYVKGTLGLANMNMSKALLTYAHLEEKEISAILPSELKDHPLLLIPPKYRQELINERLKKSPERLSSIQKSSLFHSDITKRNRMIYDTLLKSYKGDHKEVLKHIRVERFFISKRYSNGAVTIEPQMHVDANMQQITMDKRLASLPPSLQSLNLFNMSGEVILANRGILEFSDLLKRPLDAFKYLLMTMETQRINLRGILTELDIFFVGSSNEIHLTAFKQHPDFNSFKGRINFIRVPYLLNARYEEKIYLDQVSRLKDVCHFEPHALETLCLFAVLTRLRPSLEKNYENKQIGKMISTFNPLEKALYIADQVIPDRFKSEERRLLKAHFREVEKEFDYDNLYEGKFGMSPRLVKQIVYDIASKAKYATFIEVLEYLDDFIEMKNEHDFLNIPPQNDFNNPKRFNDLIRGHLLNILDEQVRDCLGLVDERSYEAHIQRYIQSITSLMKNEKLKNQVTGKFEDPDEYFINEFETSLNLQEETAIFRSNTISSLGAFSLDHPGKKIVYTEVFPGIVKKLQASFREEQKKQIKNLAKLLVFFIKETQDQKDGKVNKTASLTEENRHTISQILNNLQNKWGYSAHGALSLFQYLIKERY